MNVFSEGDEIKLYHYPEITIGDIRYMPCFEAGSSGTIERIAKQTHHQLLIKLVGGSWYTVSLDEKSPWYVVKV